MSQHHSSGRPGRVYRVDKFVVPNGAREELLSRIRDTHGLLRAQPGFLQDFLLEEPAGPGQFNLVTLVEWDGPESVERARAAVTAMHIERALRDTAEKSRPEQGCLSYELHRGLDDRSLFALYETWSDRGALKSHVETHYMRRTIRKEGS